MRSSLALGVSDFPQYIATPPATNSQVFRVLDDNLRQVALSWFALLSVMSKWSKGGGATNKTAAR